MTLSKIADTLNMTKDEREPFVQMAKHFESDVVENLTKYSLARFKQSQLRLGNNCHRATSRPRRLEGALGA